MPSVALVVGTRPEAIKMAPVYLALREDPRLDPVWVSTAQHRQLLDQVLDVFGIEPDVDLDLMRPDQSLGDLTGAVIRGVQGALANARPDAVLVHGDTTTCLGATLAAFYERIPVGHVEAGLRTYRFDAPWPEEMNRRATDPLCRWCFAPTEGAASNLRAERIPVEAIHVTGNTVVDALMMARERIHVRPPEVPGLVAAALDQRRLVLVTGHRRESFGEPLEQLCHGLAELAAGHPDVVLVYPVHLNPNVKGPVEAILGGRDRIHLIEPLEYLPFVALMDRCELIVTDSGGIQEEAPTLGKPVLVTREVTERPEAMAAGCARLVGMDREVLVTEASRLLGDADAYAAMAHVENPYGDGRAAERICDVLADALGG
jgi:UDP-N-acetylglucosamine 2-epimerase (hydrolysing)